MSKKRKTYTLAEMRSLKPRLQKQAGKLFAEVHKLSGRGSETNFDCACQIRDRAQQLVTICMVLETTLTTCMGLAEMTGDSQQVPWLEDCGLEDDLP